MADEVLRPGQNAQLQLVRQEEVRVRLSVTGAAPLRLVGILLNEHGRAVTPAPLLTWRQNNGQVQIDLGRGETISATLHTAAVQDPIQAMMFLVAPYGRETFLPHEKLFAAIMSDGAPPMAIEAVASDGAMQAIALCEFYLHPDDGVKIRARSEWRSQTLSTLLEQLGVSTKIITEQMLYQLPTARKSDAERASLNQAIQPQHPKPSESSRAATVPPSFETPRTEPQPPPETFQAHAAEVMRLDQAGDQHRWSAVNAKFGQVQGNFCWHQPVATRAQVKVGLGCLWELQDGKKGQLESTSNPGNTNGPPYVTLAGDIQKSGTQCHARMTVNGNEWPNIKRLLLYAMIHEGPVEWDALDAQFVLRATEQPAVSVTLASTGKTGSIAPLLLLENRSDQMRLTYPGNYYESHHALDAAFGFQLRWQGKSETAATPGHHEEMSWVPRKNINYTHAEDLMRASLAAGALVMIADGRVSLEERKTAITTLMQLPIGKYFAEFEVRSTFETILRDLKQQRKESESLALRILRPLRGSYDARLVVQAMRRLAMLDGRVSIQEERMVERLTRYLSSAEERA